MNCINVVWGPRAGIIAEVQLDEQQLRTQWPERAVPTAILQGAQAMDTLHTFKPTLDGPASMKAATCNLPSNEKDPQVVDDDEDSAAAADRLVDDAAEQDCAFTTEQNSGTATEHATTLPLDMPAEFLIGISEDDAHDPVDLMIVFQKNLELVREAGKRIHRLEQQRLQAAGTENAAQAASTLAAEKTKHTAALVDLRKLASKMGTEYQQQMTDALAASRMEGATANTPRTLHVRSGKPVNMFEPQAWSAAFVEFFYGDCAPNLDRPQRVGMRELFHYLARFLFFTQSSRTRDHNSDASASRSEGDHGEHAGREPITGLFSNCQAFQCQLIPLVFCCTNNRAVSGYSALLKFYSLIPHPKILFSAPIVLVPRFQSVRGHMDLIRIRLLLNPCAGAGLWPHAHVIGPVNIPSWDQSPEHASMRPVLSECVHGMSAGAGLWPHAHVMVP